jgi:TctA family transporter
MDRGFESAFVHSNFLTLVLGWLDVDICYSMLYMENFLDTKTYNKLNYFKSHVLLYGVNPRYNCCVLAFILFALSGYLGFLSIQSTDLSAKTTFLYQATTLFILGSFLIAFWIVTWIVRRNMEKL